MVSDYKSPADQIFKVGPEDLVAASRTIVAGPVAGYAKEVQQYTGTASRPGPDDFPTKWIVSGRIDQPIVLKGTARSGPLAFSRAETSIFINFDQTGQPWEENLGDVSPTGQIVVFQSDGNPPQTFKVLPSSGAEQDLIGLVKGIIEIQAIQDPLQQRQAWLRSLTSAETTSDEARRAALRSLVRGGIEWNEIAPSLKTVFSDPSLSSGNNGIKAFAFGFVDYSLKHGKWTKDGNAVVDLLCQTFAAQRGTPLEIDYFMGLRDILNYSAEDPVVESRQPWRKKIITALKQRESLGISDPTLKEFYARLHDQYKNL